MKKPTIAVTPRSLANDNTAVVQAELEGYKFACRIDSDAYRYAISETIFKFFGDNGIFLSTLFLSNPEELKEIVWHSFTLMELLE